MVERTNAGRQEQPRRRARRHHRVEHDHARHQQPLQIDLLELGARVGGAGRRIEVAAAQCRRHRDLRHLRAVVLREHALALGRDAHHETVEILQRADVVLERQPDHLAGIGDRAAAEGRDQVGFRAACLGRRFEHVVERRVRGDGGKLPAQRAPSALRISSTHGDSARAAHSTSRRTRFAPSRADSSATVCGSGLAIDHPVDGEVFVRALNRHRRVHKAPLAPHAVPPRGSERFRSGPCSAHWRSMSASLTNLSQRCASACANFASSSGEHLNDCDCARASSLA